MIWHSKHNSAAVTARIAGRSGSIEVIHSSDLATVWAQKPTAAIIATAPDTHAGLVREALRQNVPVMVEKPFVLEPGIARELIALAADKRLILGIDLELMVAPFLCQAIGLVHAALAADEHIADVSIVWADPEAEARYGDTKRADLYTHKIHDIYPHIWSIARVILADGSVDVVDATMADAYGLGGVEMTLACGAAVCKAMVSRRASHRTRHIAIRTSKQRSFELDFTVEPGALTMEGREQADWFHPDTASGTPLAVAIGGFLATLETGAVDRDIWPLGAERCLGSVDGAAAAADALARREAAWLGNRIKREPDQPDPEALAVLGDNILPELAATGVALDRSAPAAADGTVRLAWHELMRRLGHRMADGPGMAEDVAIAFGKSAFLKAVAACATGVPPHEG